MISKALIIQLFLSVPVVGLAQTNWFPTDGNAGLGTTTPYSISSYSVLDIVGKSTSKGGYIRFKTSDGSGTARIFNTNDRLRFDLQSPNMYFEYRNSTDKEVYRLNEDGAARWSGNASSYTEIASNTSGQFMRQYANNGSALSWLIRGYATNGIQAEFREGGIEVNGRVRAKEVKVETANWPDYVFHADYPLPTLPETAKFIQTHGHLEGVPGAEEVAANGVELGELNRRLLEKVEQLTLYLIEQHEEIAALKTEVERLKNRKP